MHTDPIIDIENALTRAGKRVVKRGEPACPQCRQANTEATRNRQK